MSKVHFLTAMCLSLLLEISSSVVMAEDIKGIPVDNLCSEQNPRNENELIKTKNISRLVVRKADKLFITLANGKTLTRADIPCKKADQDLCKWNDFRDYSVYDYFKDRKLPGVRSILFTFCSVVSAQNSAHICGVHIRPFDISYQIC